LLRPEPCLTTEHAVKGQITISGIWLRPFISHFTLACKCSSKPKQCATERRSLAFNRKSHSLLWVFMITEFYYSCCIDRYRWHRDNFKWVW
jgi:hypothetical protein